MRSHDVIPLAERLCLRSHDVIPLAERLCLRSHDVIPLAERLCMRSHDATPLAESLCLRSHDVIPLAERLCLRSHDVIPLAERLCSRSDVVVPLAERLCSRSDVVVPLAERLCLRSDVVVPLAERLCLRSRVVAPLAQRLSELQERLSSNRERQSSCRETLQSQVRLLRTCRGRVRELGRTSGRPRESRGLPVARHTMAQHVLAFPAPRSVLAARRATPEARRPTPPARILGVHGRRPAHARADVRRSQSCRTGRRGHGREGEGGARGSQDAARSGRERGRALRKAARTGGTGCAKGGGVRCRFERRSHVGSSVPEQPRRVGPRRGGGERGCARDPPAPVAPPPASETAAPAPMVTVHLSGPEDLALETDLGNGSWGRVCTGACDTAVPLAGEYRVVGKGIPPLQGVQPPGVPRAARRHLARWGVFQGGAHDGIVLAASSPGVFLAGFIVTIAGACAPPGGCDPGTPNRGVVDRGSASWRRAAPCW